MKYLFMNHLTSDEASPPSGHPGIESVSLVEAACVVLAMLGFVALVISVALALDGECTRDAIRVGGMLIAGCN